MLAKHHESLAQSVASSSSSSQPGFDELVTASDLLSDLQVETYSSMDRREKTRFILEQMRVLIAVARAKDQRALEKGEGTDGLAAGEPEWVKVRVSGRKINESFLTEKENEVNPSFKDVRMQQLMTVQDLKLQYYDLMIQHALHGRSYLDCAKYYHKIWETPSVKEDDKGKGKAVRVMM